MDFFDYLKDKRNIFLIISFLLNGVLIFISIYFYNSRIVEKSIEPVLAYENYSEEKKEIEKYYYVDIKGAVKKEGVYKVLDGSIINDVIELAGGFNKDAYKKNINLSKKVSDEMVIYVYTSKEYKKLTNNEEKVKIVTVKDECNCPTYDISECIQSGNSEIVTSDSETVVTKDEVEREEKNNLININTASKEELLTLPGIGSSKADSIIKYRTDNGNFNSISEITNVSGIGDSIFEKIKEYITV